MAKHRDVTDYALTEDPLDLVGRAIADDRTIMRAHPEYGWVDGYDPRIVAEQADQCRDGGSA